MPAFENQSGKISAKVFKEDLLNQTGARRPEVKAGPMYGVDTSIVDIGNEKVLCISSDPLSLIPSMGMEVSAWLSVHLLVNDMCTTGFAPQYAQFVLNLPPELSREDFQKYWGHIHTLCDKLNIAITGGHTGQIYGQNSTISGGGTMFLTAPKNEVLLSNGAKAGDSIIMTKSAAISSSSLLARAFPKTIIIKLGKAIHEKAADQFWKISVLEESQIARKTLQSNQELNAMHDVTEGGVLGACYEMSVASGLGFEIDQDKIPVAEEARRVMELFEIDPLYCIGSGCMVMSVRPGAERKLINALEKKGIPATSIGRFTAQEDHLLFEKGKSKKLEFYGEDPYWAAFFNAYLKGWK